MHVRACHKEQARVAQVTEGGGRGVPQVFRLSFVAGLSRQWKKLHMGKENQENVLYP